MVKQTVCARRSLMTNNSIKYLQRNGIGNIERDKKWRRKEIESTEMKWNEMLQLILYVHLCTTETFAQHSQNTQWFNQRISSFGRNGIYVNWMGNGHRCARSISCFLLSVSQSVSHWVSQSVWCHGRYCHSQHAIVLSEMLLHSMYVVRTLYKQFCELFSSFNLWSIKSNAIMVSHEMDYSHSIE